MTDDRERLRRVLDDLRDACVRIFGDNLIGVYVHGSVAFGCFRWDRGDIDFLVVVRDEPSQAQKEAFIHYLLDTDAGIPPKGWEMSVMLEADCRHFHHPAPYWLTYSNDHREQCLADIPTYCARMNGLDRDLAAHCTVMRAVGFALIGPAPREVFGPVDRADYIDSLLWDIDGAADEVLSNPAYFILNLCRSLAYMEEGLVLSKRGGGEWAMEHLDDEARPLVAQALGYYRDGGAPVSATAEEQRAFARRMLSRIHARIEGEGA